MDKLSELWRRLLFYIYMRRDQFDRELEEEMRFHLEMKAQENAEAGMDPVEARYAAERQFGNQTLLRERSRDMWAVRSIETFNQDLRYGARMLLKNPGFTLIAALTLALGIAANSAVFSMLNTALLQPLPVKEPEALVGLYRKIPQDDSYNRFSYPDYVAARDRNQSFSGLAAYDFMAFNLSAGAETERAWGKIVSGDYFSVLGVEPVLGRAFLPEEDRAPGERPVVVISHELWRRRFAGDPAVIGRDLTITGRKFIIVGVMPQGFRGAEVGMVPDFYAPMMMQRQIMNADDRLNTRRYRWLRVIGRLKPGVSFETARAEMEALGEQIRRETGDDFFGIAAVADFGVHPNFRGDAKRFLSLMMAMAGMVLLIACANIAGLLLARGVERRREIGIRLALGASRARLFRQTLTESLALALTGGVIGLALTPALVSGLERLLESARATPSAVALDIDARTLLFTAAVTLATGLIFGAVPAFSAARTGVAGIIKEDGGGRASGSTRLRGGFVAAQIALSLLLLAAAGLFARSLNHAQNIDPGFDSENLLLMSFDLGLQGYKPEQIRNFQRQIVERVGPLPGVRDVALANVAPLTTDSDTTVGFEGYQPPAGLSGVVINWASVAPGYFRTMGIQIVAGRAFTAQDGAVGPPVVIINETAARRYGSGVGKRIFLGQRPATVVGVARNSKYVTVGEIDRPYIYFPLSQTDGKLTLILRAAGDPAAAMTQAIDSARQTIRALDPNLPVYDVKTMDQHLSGALAGARLSALALAALACVATLLAALGVYGMTASAVNSRAREIGVRMALGADARAVVWMIIRQGAKLTAIGVVPGLLAAFMVMRLLEGFLYGITANDPLTLIVITLILSSTALLACWIPARRAAKVDPMTALRSE